MLAAEAGHRGPRIDCGAGHVASFVAYRTKRLDTVLCPIMLRRAWYHCPDCRHGLAPRDEQLDVTGASLSPGLRAMTARAGAAAPFAQAAALLTDLTGITLGTKRVERSAEADGTTAAAALTEQTQAILTRRVIPLPPPGPIPDMLYLAVDGTGVPMTPAETAGRAGKPDGRARTREAKLVCLFTQARTDDDGRPVRDPDSTSYLTTLDPVETFADLVQAEADRRGTEHIRQLVVPRRRRPLDLEPGRAALPRRDPDRRPVPRPRAPARPRRAARVHRARPHHLARRAADRPGQRRHRSHRARGACLPLVGVHAEQRDKDLAYFEINAHGMRYAHYRKLGMFVGSGAVEAGCKAVLGARLKQSGMHWTARGATGIATLRCQHASGRWNQICPPPHSQTGVA